MRSCITATAAFVLAAFVHGAFAEAPHAQIPPSIELRVPKPPTVAAGDAGAFLTYELHVTNLTPNDVRLSRVAVHAGTDGPLLHAVEDSVLRRDTWRPGPLMAPAERPVIGGGMRAVVYLWIPIERSAAPTSLRHRVTVQQLIGDSAVHEIDAGPIPVHAAAPEIGPPLRGEWVAFNGPSNASGYRRLVLGLKGQVASGQRFGIDFVRIDANNATNTGDASSNDTHHAYGEDVLAVGDGVVVEIKDGIPENVPGSNSRAVPIDLVTVSGNSVVIGLVGNSGNSTEPHLHFHMVDGLASGTATLGAEGVPYALEQFVLAGRCTGLGTGGCERPAPVTVRGGIPLQNQIVRFPD